MIEPTDFGRILRLWLRSMGETSIGEMPLSPVVGDGCCPITSPIEELRVADLKARGRGGADHRLFAAA